VNKLIIALAAGTAALFVGSASAAPLNPMTMHIDSGMETVAMVCDQQGRCWRERGARRMIQRDDSYAYERRRHRHHRHHRHHHDQRGPGIGVQVPGVSIGIGGGRW
jgi:hypothetical protein